MIKNEQRVAVLGAGAAGLSCAYELTRAGVKVDVYEASDRVGGLARSIRLWNHIVDLGPHRFYSRDNRVNALWKEVVGKDFSWVNRLTRIHYNGKFLQYPLKAKDILRCVGLFRSTSYVLSYLKSRDQALSEEPSFEDWIIKYFGRELFDEFFRAYSEKLWGISCSEIEADFANQRIRQLDFFEMFKKMISLKRLNSHRGLTEKFAYPNYGTGMVYERLAEKIKENGGRIILSTPISQVLVEENIITGVCLPQSTSVRYEHVVSTLPLTTLIEQIPLVGESARTAASKLRFRNTILVYLKVESTHVFSDNWIYIHSPELKAGRITNFRNWVPSICGDTTATILAVEFWCSEGDAFWEQTDIELSQRARKELVSLGLLDASDVSDSCVMRLQKTYPIYKKGYKKNLAIIEEALSKIEGLTVIGRAGSFKYNNQDHSILMGLLAADKILNKGEYNLWKVNTDYDEYLEDNLNCAEVNPHPYFGKEQCY